jgi:hypothetical protein
VKRNLSLIVTAFFALHIFACTPNNREGAATFEKFISVKGDDTATVIINKTTNLFRGSMQISYKSKYPDSGEINGIVRGDTLIGQFLYKYYGVKWQRKPVAFLMKDNRLILGEGRVKNTLDVVHFDNSVPINFEEEKQFVFQLVKRWEVNSSAQAPQN